MSSTLVPPTTKAEALAQAQEWGSVRSHWNDILGSAPDNATGIALAAQADAAEVQRLAALYSMLPDASPDRALALALDYAGIDGAHHKQWALMEIARELGAPATAL